MIETSMVLGITLLILIVLPRLITTYNWLFGYPSLCSSYNSNMLIVGMFLANMAHIYLLTFTPRLRMIYYISIIQSVVMDILCCMAYTLDCYYPSNNHPLTWVICNIISIAIVIVPHVLQIYGRIKHDRHIL